MNSMVTCRNGQCLPFSSVPALTPDRFHAQVLARIQAGGRICALFGFPDDGAVIMLAVLGFDQQGYLEMMRTQLASAHLN